MNQIYLDESLKFARCYLLNWPIYRQVEETWTANEKVPYDALLHFELVHLKTPTQIIKIALISN